MIRLDRVTKMFGPITAVDAVDMEVPAGAVCVLLGPSGCGKTTTMKMINRLIPPTLRARSTSTARTPRRSTRSRLRRSIGYVIQQIGLFPNKTVEDNICVVPDLLGWDRRKSRARAAELLAMVNLDPGDLPQALSRRSCPAASSSASAWSARSPPTRRSC